MGLASPGSPSAIVRDASGGAAADGQLLGAPCGDRTRVLQLERLARFPSTPTERWWGEDRGISPCPGALSWPSGTGDLLSALGRVLPAKTVRLFQRAPGGIRTPTPQLRKLLLCPLSHRGVVSETPAKHPAALVSFATLPGSWPLPGYSHYSTLSVLQLLYRRISPSVPLSRLLHSRSSGLCLGIASPWFGRSWSLTVRAASGLLAVCVTGLDALLASQLIRAQGPAARSFR